MRVFAMKSALYALSVSALAVSASQLVAPDDWMTDAPRMWRALPRDQAVHRVAPNDPSLTYSPYNWAVTSTSASSINGGAYFKVLVQSTFLNLTFDVSNMVSKPSQLYFQVDNGPLFSTPIAASISVDIPKNNTHGDVPWHTLTVIIKSTTETANRWAATGQSTRVIFTGLIIDGDVSQFIPSTANMLIYGDSITEGVLTLGGSQSLDTDHNDAVLCWSSRLGTLLGAEVGVVGFGATGLSRGGSGGVPALGVSWNQVRAFTATNTRAAPPFTQCPSL